MKFNCSYCNNPIDASEEHYGSTTNCPHCEKPIRVPDPIREEKAKREAIRTAQLEEKRLQDRKLTRKLLVILSVGITLAAAAIAVFFVLSRPPAFEVLEAESSEEIKHKRTFTKSLQMAPPLEVSADKKKTHLFLQLYVKIPMKMKETLHPDALTLSFDDGSTGTLVALKLGGFNHFEDPQEMLNLLKAEDFSPTFMTLLPPKYEPDDPTVIGLLFVVPKKALPGAGSLKIRDQVTSFSAR